MNRAANPTLCSRGRCRFHTIGRGMMIITRSVTIQNIGGIMATSCLLPQCPEAVGFQFSSMGMQIKQWASMVPIHHNTMITPIAFIASRNAGVMKMRWKRITTEDLVKKSAVHWSVPVVYQSCGCQGQHNLHERTSSRER